MLYFKFAALGSSKIYTIGLLTVNEFSLSLNSGGSGRQLDTYT